MKVLPKRLWALCLILLIVSCSSSRQSGHKKNFSATLAKKDQVLAFKLFNIFSEFNNNPRLARQIYTSQQSQKITDGIKRRYEQALVNCTNSRCLAKAFKIQTSEINDISSVIEAVNSRDPSIVKFLRQHLPFGYVFPGTDKEFIVQYVKNAFGSVNYIINIYLEGNSPRYPKIDHISFADNDPDFFRSVKRSLHVFLKRPASENVFFYLPMLTALKLLELNGRDEAARYEPLTSGINSEAYKRVKSTSWTQFEFSAILVPGLGPQLAGVALDPGAARRCVLAAEQFRKGVAPFIIVSGGHVHPFKTPYSEAVEMKKYLVERLKIPEYAVIAEPYARHTTTNIRNGTRMVLLFDMPEKKPVLIVTDILQATYLMLLRGRFIDELGYLPYQTLKKSYAGMYTFLPDSSALQLNPFDPLDP